MSKFYQHKFTPKNPKKYKGDVTKIFYRSSWECRVMSWLDNTEEILEWASEEIIIRYVSPIDNSVHRYFPDFWVRMKTDNGIKTYILEVKPYKQTRPPKPPKKKSLKYINEVSTYLINMAKFDAAKTWCEEKNIEFKILTEKDIFGSNK